MEQYLQAGGTSSKTDATFNTEALTIAVEQHWKDSGLLR